MNPSTRSAAPSLHVVLSAEQLDELASLVARKILESSSDDLCDQDNLPPGLSRRTYLDAARRGEFSTRKIGRRLVVKREDLEAWVASRPSGARPPKRPAAPVVDPGLAEIVSANGAKLQ